MKYIKSKFSIITSPGITHRMRVGTKAMNAAGNTCKNLKTNILY
jgi:hypothetical protein